MKALRCIDKQGGIDNYILFTDEKDIDSTLGLELKQILIPAWEKKNDRKYDQRAVLFKDRVTKWEMLEERCDSFGKTVIASILEKSNLKTLNPSASE